MSSVDMEAIWSSSASSTAIAAAGVGVPDDDIASGVGFGLGSVALASGRVAGLLVAAAAGWERRSSFCWAYCCFFRERYGGLYRCWAFLYRCWVLLETDLSTNLFVFVICTKTR
jgi:hypothetical protein